jgi:hypothetical protein
LVVVPLVNSEGRLEGETKDMSEGAFGIDVADLQRLIADNPREFRSLLKDATCTMEDRFGRSIKKLDKVTTPAGEAGMVIRLDKKSKRVLVELKDGRTRLLMAHRVEVRRGRPRKNSLKVVA